MNKDHRALKELAEQCNAEIKAISLREADEFARKEMWLPVLNKYSQLVVGIVYSFSELKYHMAILNGLISKKR